MFIRIRLGVEIRKLGPVIFMSETSIKGIRSNLSNASLLDSEELLRYFLLQCCLVVHKFS